MVGNVSALNGVRATVIPAVGVRVVSTGGQRIGLPGEMCRLRLDVLSEGEEVLRQWHLPDTRPVATELQIWLETGDDDARIDGIRRLEWVFARAPTRAALDDWAVVRPVAWAWVVRCGYTNGTVPTAGVADSVVDIELVAERNGLGSPWGGPVTFGDDAIGIQGIT